MRSTWYATYVCNVKSISMTVDKSEVCNLCISESSRERQDGVEGRAGQGRPVLLCWIEQEGASDLHFYIMAPSLLHLLFQKLPKFLSWCRKVEIQWSVICEQHKLQIKIIWVSNVFIHLEECNLLLGLVKALQGCLWFSRIILQITQNLQRNSKQDKFSHSCFLFPA